MEQKRPLARMHKESQEQRLREFLAARRMEMGEIRARIRLEKEGERFVLKSKKSRRKPRVVEIDAIVDTGAVMMLLPQEIVDELRLEPKGKSIVLLANDQKIELFRAGGVALTIAGREMTTDCLVGPPGCEPLVGQIVMESLDLIPDPVQRTLTPRPESPFRPTLKMKAAFQAALST